jgi:hypothetical protein
MRYAWVVIAACGGAPSQPEPARQPAAAHAAASCAYQPPTGDASLQTVHELPGFTIAAPQTCSHDQAYIRIERLAGSRELGIASDGRGFYEGCMEPAKFMSCSKLNVGAVLELVRSELVGENFVRPSVGGGPCTDVGGDYDGWKFAVGVHDWKNVDPLITKVAEVFDRYDLKGYVGVSVYGTPCFEFL